MDRKKKKVALVLSGGGARGFAHIGVIEELLRRDYEITSIAGTSMGALVGGAYATGNMEALKQWLCSLDRARALRLVDFTLNRQGLIKADRVLNKMREYVPDMLIEDLPLPYAAVAVDLVDREEVVFREGSLYQAIRASIAIPSVITPVRMEDRLLVDGGVLNNIPMSQVARTRGDIMVAVYVNASIPEEEEVDPVEDESPHEKEKRERAYQKKLHELQEQLRQITPSVSIGLPIGRKKHEHQPLDDLGHISMIMKSYDLMSERIAEERLARYSPDILVQVSRFHCGVYDFYRAESQIEEGRRAAIRVLDSLA